VKINLLADKQRFIDTPLDASDLITHYLEQIDTEFVFGIPGGAIEPLYNALARSERRGGVRSIVTRHESGAVFMADGYTRQTGKLGACCATTGPGATNMITGLADAYENNVPMLAITAQTPLPTFGRGAFQESSCTGIDIVSMFQYCTRYNSLVSHIEQLQHKLITAIMTAFQSPIGPVHLSIPIDILREPINPQTSCLDLKKLLRAPQILDSEKTRALHTDIGHAKQIALVLGGGCGEAVGAILDFAELTGAYIITTPHGKGLVREDHPQYCGVIGFAGHASAREVLASSSVDLVIAIETNLGEWASAGWNEELLLNERLVHVDSIGENLTRSPMARLHVRGRVLTVFEQLLELLKVERTKKVKQGTTETILPTRKTGFTFSIEEEAKCESNDSPIKPQRLMRELNRCFPANTRFFADTGNSLAWAVHYLQPKDRRANSRRGINGGLFRSSIEFSAMGWAIGASIGATLGYQKGPVVCITGDGSFLMSGQELSVAVAEKLCVIFVILNDAALGMVKHGQRLNNAEQIGYQLPQVDFAAIARAMGAQGHTIHSPQDIEKLDITRICKRRGPTLLDVHIDGEEVPPIGVRLASLRSGVVVRIAPN
jgi:acetolactate synthase-1/2/3 large subunit